jgi:hypothetical protein
MSNLPQRKPDAPESILARLRGISKSAKKGHFRLGITRVMETMTTLTITEKPAAAPAKK